MPGREYDDFYEHYEPFVAAYVGRRVHADAVADLVAEVFVASWRRREVVPANALPWLYRTAHNVIGNAYRSESRLQSLREKLGSVPAEHGRDPAAVAADRQRLLQAFADLSDDDRELLLLVAWEGLAVPDIAEVLDLSPGATSVRLHRARARFEAGLGNDPEQREPSVDITSAQQESKGQRP